MDKISGKTVLITGATSGIGKDTARQLAAKGMNVVLHGRNEKKAEKSVMEIIALTGNPNVSYVLGDLSSLASVRGLADSVLNKHSRLDVLINNAGGIFMEGGVSADGYEITFAVNYLSHYLLTRLLVKLLEKSAPSRIITLGSVAHKLLSKIDIDSVSKPGIYKGLNAYSAAKICEIMFAYDMAERLKEKSIVSNSVHPGYVRTGFALNSGNALIRGLMHIGGVFAKPPEKGAETSVYLASSDKLEGVTGKYYADSRPAVTTRITRDQGLQKKLYIQSEEMVKKFL